MESTASKNHGSTTNSASLNAVHNEAGYLATSAPDTFPVPYTAEQYLFKLIAQLNLRKLNPTKVSLDSINESFNSLITMWDIEERPDLKIIHHAKSHFNDADYEKCLKTLTDKILPKLRVLDLPRLLHLLQSSKQAEELIQNRDILLLLGKTGAGKSLTLHFLAGSKLSQVIDKDTGLNHIDPVEPISGTEAIKATPYMRSETRYIAAVNVDYHNKGPKSAVVCDAPGFDDTRGEEINLSNGIGFIKAIKSARSVKPVLLINQAVFDNRGRELAKELLTLTKMLPTILDHLDSVSYIFNRINTPSQINPMLQSLVRDIDNKDSEDTETVIRILVNMFTRTGGSILKKITEMPSAEELAAYVGQYLYMPNLDPSLCGNLYIVTRTRTGRIQTKEIHIKTPETVGEANTTNYADQFLTALRLAEANAFNDLILLRKEQVETLITNNTEYNPDEPEWENAWILDPLKADRTHFLLKFEETEGIPADKFTPFVSPDSISILLNQLNLTHKEIQQALQRLDFDGVHYRLGLLESLYGFLQEPKIFEVIRLSMSDVIKSLQKLKEQRFERLELLLSEDNSLQPEAVDSCISMLGTLGRAETRLSSKIADLIGIRKSAETTIIVQHKNLLEQLKKQPVIELKAKALDKMKLLKDKIALTELTSTYGEAQHYVLEAFKAISDQLKMAILEQNWEACAHYLATAHSFRKLEQHLADYLDISSELTAVESAFKESIAKVISEATASFEQDHLKHDLALLKQSFELLTKLQNTRGLFLYWDENFIEQNFTLLAEKVSSYYASLKTQLVALMTDQKQRKTAFADSEKIINELESLRLNLPVVTETYPELFSECIEMVCGYIRDIKRDTDQLLNNFLNEREVDLEQLLESFSTLNKVKWINRLRPEVYDEVIQKMYDSILRYASSLKDIIIGLLNNFKVTKSLDAVRLSQLADAYNRLQMMRMFVPEISELNAIYDGLSSFNDDIKDTIKASIYPLIDNSDVVEFKTLAYDAIEKAFILLKSVTDADFSVEIKEFAQDQKTKLENHIKQYADVIKKQIQTDYDELVASVTVSLESAAEGEPKDGPRTRNPMECARGLLACFKELEYLREKHEKTIFSYFPKNIMEDWLSVTEPLGILVQYHQEVEFDLTRLQYTHQLQTIEKHLPVLKALCLLDRFVPGISYREVYKKYEQASLSNLTEEVQNTIKLIESREWEEVGHALAILQKVGGESNRYYLTVLTNKLNWHLNNLREEVESGVAMLSPDVDSTTSVKEVTSIVKNILVMKKVEYVKDFLDPTTSERWRDSLKAIETSIADYITEYLSRVTSSIEAHDFKTAENRLRAVDNMKKVFAARGYNIIADIEAKIKTERANIKHKLEELVGEYKEMELEKYAIKPPKEVCEKLSAVQPLTEDYSNAIKYIEEAVNTTMRVSIGNARKVDPEVSRKILRSLKIAATTLSEPSASIMKTSIEDTEQDLKDSFDAEEADIKALMDTGNVYDMKNKYYECQERKLYPLANMIKTGIRKVLESMTVKIQADLRDPLAISKPSELFYKIDQLSKYKKELTGILPGIHDEFRAIKVRLNEIYVDLIRAIQSVDPKNRESAKLFKEYLSILQIFTDFKFGPYTETFKEIFYDKTHSAAAAHENSALNESHATLAKISSDEASKRLVERLQKIIINWSDLEHNQSMKVAIKRSKKSYMKSEAYLRFMENPNLKGFVIKEANDDGNCFFHAVAEQLISRFESADKAWFEHLKADLGGRVEHDTLRKLAVGALTVMIHNGELQHFGDDSEMSIDQAANDGVWANDYVISALARALKIKIVLINSNNTEPTIVDGGGEHCIFLGYIEGLHFNSLHGNASKETYFKEKIQNMLKNAAPATPIDRSLAAELSGLKKPSVAKVFEDTSKESFRFSPTGDSGPIKPEYDVKLEKAHQIFTDWFIQIKYQYDEACQHNSAEKLAKALDLSKLYDEVLLELNRYINTYYAASAEPFVTKLKTIPTYESMREQVSYLLSGYFEAINRPLLNDKTQFAKADRDAYFREMSAYYKLIKAASILDGHLVRRLYDINSLTICEKHLNHQINQIVENIHSLIASAELNLESCREFEIKYDTLRSLSDNFDASEVIAGNAQDKRKRLYFKMIEKLDLTVNAIKDESNSESIVEGLIQLKTIATYLPGFFDKEVNDRIDFVLDEYNKRANASEVILDIWAKLDKEISGMGTRIINEHRAFKEFLIKSRNTETLRHGIDEVLLKIRGDELDEEVKKTLAKLYRAFDEQYWELVEKYDKPAGLESLAAKIKAFSAHASDRRDTSWRSADIKLALDILPWIFAYWTLLNSGKRCHTGKAESKKVGIDKGFYMQPHPAQIVSIFRLLGADQKLPSSSFTSIFSGSSHYLNQHLVQIGTGEGKSITLAALASVLSIMGFDISCACYSEYLSARDYEDFRPMYESLGLVEHIHYGTFQAVCESLINENGSIRDQVEASIAGYAKMASKGKKMSNRAKILLIDEVDVFFNTDFYGKPYSVQAQLKDPTVNALVGFIWTVQKSAQATLPYIKASKAYKDCCDRFKGWEFLIESAVIQMINDLKSFRDIRYETKDGRIMYYQQDGLSDKVVYGYKTLFAYYNECEKGLITSHVRDDFTAILINSGIFSYAEVPHSFKCIMGVTGTLEALNDQQKEIIKSYRIHKSTYAPSVYGENKRRFDNVSGADVHITSGSEYFMTIVNEISRIRDSSTVVKRPVMIFFESIDSLLEFYNSTEFSRFRTQTHRLTERNDASEKAGIVARATANGSVTLATRSMGRGTDFVCYDRLVKNNGGLHVIQTFLSEEYSEEVQIQGRTARQGNDGSYSMVILDSSLEKFGLSLQEVEPLKRTATRYNALDDKRKASFAKSYPLGLKNLVMLKEEHLETLKFVKALSGHRLNEIKFYLQSWNDQVAGAQSRTICLMDATLSMGELLAKAKVTVNRMFERAITVLQEAGIDKGFELQLAFYRNYGSGPDMILQVSDWSAKPDRLNAFMSDKHISGGQIREAIEIGLFHAVQEAERGGLSQVILIGDAPPNTEHDVKEKRRSATQEGVPVNWSKTRYPAPTHYRAELAKLTAKGIPVHAFYVNEAACESFTEIASATGGNTAFLDVNSDRGEEFLTNFVTKQILSNVGGRSKGAELVSRYQALYEMGNVASSARPFSSAFAASNHEPAPR